MELLAERLLGGPELRVPPGVSVAAAAAAVVTLGLAATALMAHGGDASVVETGLALDLEVGEAAAAMIIYYHNNIIPVI